MMTLDAYCKRFDTALAKFNASSTKHCEATLDLCEIAYTAATTLDENERNQFFKHSKGLPRYRYMRIGYHAARLRPFAQSLPAALGSLFMIARLDTATIRKAVDKGVLTPTVERAVIRDLLRGTVTAQRQSLKPLAKKNLQPAVTSRISKSLTSTEQFQKNRDGCFVVIDIVNDASFDVAQTRAFLRNLVSFLTSEHARYDCIDPDIILSPGLKFAIRKDNPASTEVTTTVAGYLPAAV